MSTATLEAPLTTEAATATKRPRRQVDKATRSPKVDKAPTATKKTGLYLSPKSLERLGLAALMEGRSQSEIVDRLIDQHLRRWVVSDRARESVADPAMFEVSAES